jgi:hypothetical protein
LKDFLAFWQAKLEGPLYAVTVAHSKLIKPAELHAVDGVFRLQSTAPRTRIVHLINRGFLGLRAVTEGAQEAQNSIRT